MSDDLIKKANSLLEEGKLLNEGSSRKSMKEVIKHFKYLTADVVKGSLGKNGSKDPKHSDWGAIRDGMKAVEKALDKMYDNMDDQYEEIWLREFY